MATEHAARFQSVSADAGVLHDPVALGEELAQEVQRRFLEKLRSREKPSSRQTNRASSLGDPCLRRLVLWRTKGHEAKEIDDVGLAIFHEGHLLEGPIRRLVEELGFEVHSGQQSFPYNSFNVSGHIDGKIAHPRMPVLYILEIKTVNGVTWKQLGSHADIREHKKSWVSKWSDQGQLYAGLSEILRWGEELPVLGVLYVLFNKWTGQLKAIPAPLDYKHAEALLDKSVAIEAHVADGTLPDFIEDREECETCPFFGRACHPPIDHRGTAFKIVDDLDVVAAVETMQNARGSAKDFQEAKDYLFGDGGRLRGIELALVPCPDGQGHYEIRGKFSPNTTYKVPPEIREPYKDVNPTGKWLPKVELVKPAEGA